MITKLMAVQSELKAPKNQFNSFGKYKYRSCEDILEAVKPLCIKHGLLLTVSDKMEEFAGKVYVTATATVQDRTASISVSASAREAETKKGMDEAQITGSASSYARKYALNGLFCIDDTKDADSTNTHGKEPVRDLTPDALLVEEYYQSFKTAETPEELRQMFSTATKGKSPQEQKAVIAAKDIRKEEMAI